MKKILIIAIVLFLSWQTTLLYNTLVTKQEAVDSAFSQVQSNIQRKADLLENLVQTLSRYVKYEKNLLTKITELRSEVKNQPKTNNNIQKVGSLNKQLQGITHTLLLSVENYPDLKASEQFLELQAQIEGSENRINITRMNYNEAVKEYNTLLKKFPYNLIAKIVDFQQKPYYKVTTKTDTNYQIKIQ
ncbi:MAG: LemA family protein [Epsilonproteobacteria bacterium]|nr:LemA family protein [Campylobacterota bacterium]